MILTFYSYKGGVGRSMALANLGDALARQGLRVLMIDFDLEAPGLEQFFPINYRQFRSHAGLLDLLLSYKQAMSQASGGASEQAAFRKLKENFIVPVYDQLPSGGRLDLMPAGQRGDEEQLARYALNLRTFDWQDFYFNWAGELFFDWMRQTVSSLYDLVLVDSRTGVTEMGGVCAYQLADTIAMFCASNYQNLQGTLSVIQNFFSKRVQTLRHNRPLQLLVVPSRVEQRDTPLLKDFHERFEDAYKTFTPEALNRVGLSFWDLMIPYEPHYSFQEQVIASRSTMNNEPQVSTAYQRMLEAIIAVAEPDTPLGKLHAPEEVTPIIHAQYDITRSRAGYDLFLFYHPKDADEISRLASRLAQKENNIILFDPGPFLKGKNWQPVIESALDESRSCAVLLGPSGLFPWENEELRKMIETRLGGIRPMRMLPLLMPGSVAIDPTRLPGFIADQTWWDLRGGIDPQALEPLVRVLRGEGDDPGKSKSSEREQITPYIGLRPFQEQEAGLFFGRSAMIEQAVDRLKDKSSLFIIGPSGCGKSSLVSAGLIPTLRHNAIPGSQNWIMIHVRPGSDPLESLAYSLAQVRGDGQVDRKAAMGLKKELKDNTQELLFLADSLDIRQRKIRLVLIVDQMEDLWVLGSSEEDRKLFLQHLAFAATSIDTPYVVLFILRADYYTKIANEPLIGQLAVSNQLLINPMTREELAEAIIKPAQLAGLAFEPGLPEVILNDLGDEPGSLPLLQNVLFLLSQQSSQGFLTHAAYQSLGGLQGALSGFAETIFSYLTPAQQGIARDVLLRLVGFGEGGTFTRRRVPLDELIPAGGANEETERVIKHCVDGRLLVTFHEGGNVTYEIAHDYLIVAWPRLRGWLEEDREALIFQRRLTESAAAWINSGRDESFLLRGARFTDVEEWAQSHPDRLTASENEFIKACQVLRQRELKRARQRTLALTVGLVITSIAMVIAVFFNFQFNQSIIRINGVSTGISGTATSQGARNVLLSTQVVLLNATNQAMIQQSDQNAAQKATSEALLKQQSEMLLSTLNASAVTRSPDGRLLATINPDGSITVWDVTSGKALANFRSSGTITAVTFSPDANLLATGDQFGVVNIWDINTQQNIIALPYHKGQISNLAFSPDGQFLASADEAGMVLIWGQEGRMFRQIGPEIFVVPPVTSISFNSDGISIQIVDQKGANPYFFGK